jgi:hypothetical protein
MKKICESPARYTNNTMYLALQRQTTYTPRHTNRFGSSVAAYYYDIQDPGILVQASVFLPYQVA